MRPLGLKVMQLAALRVERSRWVISQTPSEVEILAQRAAWAGLPSSANPYPVNTTQNEEWRCAYFEWKAWEDWFQHLSRRE